MANITRLLSIVFVTLFALLTVSAGLLCLERRLLPLWSDKKEE
jgi:hypothetical protein